MTDLLPMSALGSRELLMEAHGDLTIREVTDVALASVAISRDVALPQPFGLMLPGPGSHVSQGGISAVWTGQRQWMIAAAGEAETDFAARLYAEVPVAAVTEQTDGWVVLDVESSAGDAAIHHLLERLVNIDPRSFGPGSATRTGLEHMGVIVVRSAANRVAIWGMRSAAGTLWHAVSVAARRLAGPATAD
ncbi:sarcosine oxidase subunit gamma [Tepidamorphus sp. 3E244]|uniref:sarcosine oxidase subunit gamma n=1 Tax=Tepidamorphus sp. 3E244 TaxID=3385498 RepID=UPI0038FC2A3A